jgi:hypothetical protein
MRMLHKLVLELSKPALKGGFTHRSVVEIGGE